MLMLLCLYVVSKVFYSIISFSMNTNNTTFLIIGSSNKKAPLDYKGVKGNLGLEGVLQDFKLFYKRLGSHKKIDHLQTSNHNSAGLHSMDDIKTWLKNKFNDKNSKYFILFYSGHGNEHTGNLAIDTKENPNGDNFELKELVSIWKRQRKNYLHQSKLYLILDSCYSGNWCYTLAQMNQPTIGIFSVCHQNQKAYESSKGGCLINCVLGPPEKFEDNFDALVNKHTPKFINNSQKPTNLKRYDLKEINKSISQILNTTSSYDNEDKYEISQGNNKNGSIYYKNGQLYHGDWNNKKQPDGYGRFIYNSGEQFEGNWKDGKYHGKGEFKMLGGFNYVGKWKQGQLDGEGTLKLSLQETVEPNVPLGTQITNIYVTKQIGYTNGKLTKEENHLLEYAKYKTN